MKSELKVLFYLKKNETKKCGLFAVMGRIAVDSTVPQFSLKIEANSKLWDTKVVRMISKSKQSLNINRESDQINHILHTHYKELKEIHHKVDVHDLKNAIQDIASSQDAILAHFRTMNETVAQRIGIDYSQAASEQYINAYKALERFFNIKLKMNDISFKALTFSFIEEYYQYL